MELYATIRALSNPIEIIPKVLSEGAISSRFNLGSDVNCGLDHGRSAPGRRSRNGKLPDDLSFQVYVRRIEGTICLYVYPLLNTGIPNKFLAALRLTALSWLSPSHFAPLGGPKKTVRAGPTTCPVSVSIQF